MKLEDYTVDLNDTTKEELLKIINEIGEKLQINFTVGLDRSEKNSEIEINLIKPLDECELDALKVIYEVVVLQAKLSIENQ